jgi:hypothetical protein
VADFVHISSPEVLKDLRRALIVLRESSERIIPETLGDVPRVQHWLEQERFPEVKRQQRNAENRYSEARIRYLAAKSRAPKMGRPMIEDEEKDYRRCKAILEQTEQKLATISKAIIDVPRMIEAPTNRIRAQRAQVVTIIDRAVAQIDHMIDQLEIYLQQSGEDQ